MRKLLKYPKAIVVICLLITAILGIQLKNLEMDNSLRQFMPQKDPSYLRMLDTEEQFGSMITTAVSLETQGKTILTPRYIDIIDKLTKRFESIESVESVTSLTNVDYIEGVDGALVAGSLLGNEYVGSEEDVTYIKEKLTSWSELYDRVIISEDQRAVQIQVTLKKGATAEEKQEMLDSIYKILDEETAGFNLITRVYGDPVISEQAKIFMLKDLRYLIPLVVLVVLLSLLFSFGTVDGTVLPLLAVLMSTIWSVGLMAVFNHSFSIVSSVIPVALIAVGSAYGIHVLTHYYVALDRSTGPITAESYKEIVFSGLDGVKSAVKLAGVTTIVGFISLMTSPIKLNDFGSSHLSFDVAANYKIGDFRIDRADFDVTMGLGVNVGIPLADGKGFDFSVLVPFGVVYHFTEAPIDVYFRLAPGVQIVKGDDVGFGFGFSGFLGALWRFN